MGQPLADYCICCLAGIACHPDKPTSEFRYVTCIKIVTNVGVQVFNKAPDNESNNELSNREDGRISRGLCQPEVNNFVSIADSGR